MPRTRAARAKLAEEGAPLSPSQSLSNERRRRNRVAPDDNASQAPSQSPPDEDEDSTQSQTQATQDSATPPPEEHLETRSTRRPTRKLKTRQTQSQSRTNRTDEIQTQSRTYRTGEIQTSISPPHGHPQTSISPPQRLPQTYKTAETQTSLSPSYGLPHTYKTAETQTSLSTPDGLPHTYKSAETQTSTSPPYGLPQTYQNAETQTSLSPSYGLPHTYKTAETQTSLSTPDGLPHTYKSAETQTSTSPPYGLPQIPFPDKSQVHVQLGWNNRHLHEDERTLALNIPADVLPAMLSFVTQHPQMAGTDLLRQLEESPLYQQLLKDHDNDRVQVLTVFPGAKKRKREQEPTIESILEAKIQKDQAERDQLRTQNPTPSDTDRERLRQAQIEETQNVLRECRDSRANEPRRKRTRTKTVLDPYDEKGNFILCRYKTVEYEIDDEPEEEQGLENTQEQTSGNSFTENIPPQQHEPTSTDDAAPISTETTKPAPKKIKFPEKLTESPYNEDEVPYKVVPLEESFPEEQPQAQTHAEPETPRAQGWGFTSIITSSVSKFLPFGVPAITPSQPPAQPEPQVLNEPRARKRTPWRKILRGKSTDWHNDDEIDDTSINGDHTSDPPAVDTTPHQAVNGHHTPDPPAVDTTPHQAAKPGEIQKLKEELEQELRMKIEAEYKAKALEESERLTAALSKKVKEVDECGQRFYRERKKLAQHLDEIIPGRKRKRMPSPEVIPNPVGGGFGMDLDYFYISDEDSDEEHITPVRRPPPKKVRTSSHGRELIGSPSGNVGEASSTSQNGSQHSPSNQVTPTQGAQTGRASSVGTNLNGSLDRNVFEESQSAENDPDYAPNGPTMTFRVPSPTSSDDDDSLLDHESQHDITAPLSPLASKPTAPKQRPTPNYTTMPAPSHLVEIARKKALIHQPKTGSSLRNASRFSISTTASDVGEEQSSSVEAPREQHSKADETAERETMHQNYLTTHVDVYEEYMKGISPKVAALMKETWTDEDTEMAEKAFDSELENFDEAEAEAWINENYEALKAGQVAGAAA